MGITTGALALGSTIIGGGGSSDIEDLINDYAKGRIICDTSTMQVGDAVRVRSVTTNEYTDKTVTIVGGCLVFNVLCKDYYKICMLQGGGHQITIKGYDSESYVDINIFDGMIGTGLRVYSSITSGAPNSYTGNGIDLYFDDNSNKWVLKSIGTIIYQNQQYTSGQTIEEWSGQVNISLEEIPTEIGGEYVEIGFGDLHRSNVLNKTTLGGVQGILNANQQATLLSVGDEVDITVNGAQEKWLIAHINPSNASYPSNSVILCRKEVYGAIKITNKHYKNGNLKSYMADFYNMISENDRAYIKQKTVNAAYNTSTIDTSIDNYVWSPTSCETNATVNTNETSTNVPFALFATAVGRTRGGNYWTASGFQNGSGMVYVNANGVNNNSGDLSPTYATLPCIMLTEDS